MSRSTYTRFAEGKTHISVNLFMNIIDRLNLSLGEFDYIKNGYRNTLLYQFNRNAMKDVLNGDIKSLLLISDELYPNINKNNNQYNKYFNLYCAINILINEIRAKHGKLSNSALKHKNKPFVISLKNYLLKRYTWTRYEMVLFNDIYFIFNVNIVNIFVKRTIKNLRKYNHFQNYENEGFRLLINITIYYLNHHTVNDASKLLSV